VQVSDKDCRTRTVRQNRAAGCWAEAQQIRHKERRKVVPM
jgi:hypothetical protein